MKKPRWNSTPKALRLKSELERLGHTNVRVWWETISGALEMCGPSGGFMFHSDQERQQIPLGLSFGEAKMRVKAHAARSA